ncbi:MAG: TraR/DksA family transcriptional regulator [Acidimicrobiales bacterium]
MTPAGNRSTAAGAAAGAVVRKPAGKAPVKTLAKAQVKTLAKAPVKTLAKAPVKTLAKAPVKTVAKAPVKTAGKAPVKAPPKTVRQEVVGKPGPVGKVARAAVAPNGGDRATPPTAAAARTTIKKAVKSAVSPSAKKSAGAGTKVGPYADDAKFLDEQRHLLVAERAVHEAQASDLKAEADSLAQEREPGDVQFDEESGEGGTVTVDRERDLALSAQAAAAVEEIDDALSRIDVGTYGACERCHQPIPKPRLRALPFARLCVACKSGGLSRR